MTGIKPRTSLSEGDMLAIHCASCGQRVAFLLADGTLMLVGKHHRERHETHLRLDDLWDAWAVWRGR